MNTKTRLANAIKALKKDIVLTENRLRLKEYIDVEHKLELENLLMELKDELFELESENEL